ncbi:endoribonuclease Dicer-like isoform X2 [Oratosquilla oratoria]|uniref:endoribonuclease Dicer-like isoform X2 n=2 Tax=Oratosquilla oratoria TaxID=337810 RepID=UPI003F765401
MRQRSCRWYGLLYEIQEKMAQSNYTTSEDSAEEQPAVKELVPRSYQLELYEKAKGKNCIIVLGTGTGKTLIAILLIKEFGKRIYGSVHKKIVYVVNTVPLVHQQHEAICKNTDFKTGKYEGFICDALSDEEWWEKEIYNNQVIVISAQILVDLILHARLRIRDINLIIMDECHHATGKHPMHEIMREYIQEEKDNRPRIIGLTSCIIHNLKKINCKNIDKEMKHLEMVMDSTLMTTTDKVSVEKYTTMPEEKIIKYSNTSNENVQDYDNLLKEIGSKYRDTKGESENDIGQKDVSENDIGQKDVSENYIGQKDVSDMNKIVRNIKNICINLGPWGEMQALVYEIENIKEKAEMEDNPAMARELNNLSESLRIIYNEKFEDNDNNNTKFLVTDKVNHLLEVLKLYRTYGLHCIIFVEQRCMAKLLYDLLQKVKPYENKLDYLNPAYVVGSNHSLDIKLAQLELKKQTETLDKFRKGKFNVIVSTSVLEEGIDVPVCNVIIRFDPPSNFRSYVQARGRARDTPSQYVFFASKDGKVGDDISSYKKIENYLKSNCHDRKHPNEEDIRNYFKRDESLPPYAPYDALGAKVTMVSVLGLINKYCQTLPQDKFTELAPFYKFINCTSSGVTWCNLLLPVSSPLKEVKSDESQGNKDLAKRHVALIACQKLHEIHELNSNLLPIPLRDEDLFQGFKIPDEALPKEGQGKAGSRKRRQVYEKGLCSAYKDFSSRLLYSICIEHTERNLNFPFVSSSNSSTHLGLLVNGPICKSPFPLHSNKFGKVVVTFKCLSENYKLDNLKILERIENFHKMVFEISVGISANLHEFKEKLPLLILPLKKNNVDFELLKKVSVFHPLKLERPRCPKCIPKDKFSDAVVIPWYRFRQEIFVVTSILDNLTPCSDFPENEDNYKTYKDYYKKKYDIEIYDDNQFLLEAEHIPKGLSLFEPVPIKSKVSRKPHLVPELCKLAPFKASLLWQIMLLPSILHRSNILNLCHEFGSQIFDSISLIHDKISCFYDWPKFQIEKIMACQNFCAALHCMESIPIHPLMILNALTLKSACDAFDIERLEILGDSFLKFLCGERLFLESSSDHEGKLTQKRSFLVSNKTLYAQAWLRGIPKLIQGTKFVADESSFLYGFQIKPMYEEQLLEQKVPANRWRTVKIQDGKIVQDTMGYINDKKHEDCYNPWTHQQIADKSTADVVEALIGVCLLTGGPKRAIKFLEWIHLPIPEKKMMPHTALIQEDPQSIANVKKMYEESSFHQLEKILQYQFKEQSFLLQALTHPSYKKNRITESYQRLEFLGDAVLDYLITGHIYSKFENYPPGKLTDLRCHLVNNETLAKVAVKHNLQEYLLHKSTSLKSAIDTFIKLIKSGETEFIWENEVDEVQAIELPKALSDIVESLIGAVYLDSEGELQVIWDIIFNLMGDLLDNIKDIPYNCVRQVHEMDPAAKFTRTNQDSNEYTLTVCGKTFVGKGKKTVARIAIKCLRT